MSTPKELVPRFFDNTANTYDRIAIWCTFGKDRFWKNEILRQIPHIESILDLACGTGILTRKIAKKYPDSKIVGIDITENYLRIAETKTAYENILYVHQDAEKLKLNMKFDCIVSSYIPKYCNPEILIKKCISHLNPHGKIILHDFIYPKNIFVKVLWEKYFVLLNMVGNFIPSWKDAFVELPKLIKTSNWVDNYNIEMKKNGLDVKYHTMTWNSSAIIIGTKI